MKFFSTFVFAAFCLVLATPHTAMAVETKETEHQQILRISRDALKDVSVFTAENLDEDISANGKDLHIISLQSEEEYAKGHVPGAVRVPLNPQGAIADIPAMLASLPKEKTIVVVCSNGQLSCHATLLLRQLGYNARSLLLGMQAWNSSYAGKGAYKPESLALSTAPTPLPLGPVAASSPSGQDDAALILKRTAEYYAQGRPVSISRQQARDMWSEALVLSLQSAEDYAYSHIEGAANLPADDVKAGTEDLLRLPRDKKIIVTCYLGHNSNTGALLLNQLGYEAYSLDWGLSGWNPEGLKYIPLSLKEKNDLPVQSGK